MGLVQAVTEDFLKKETEHEIRKGQGGAVRPRVEGKRVSAPGKHPPTPKTEARKHYTAQEFREGPRGCSIGREGQACDTSLDTTLAHQEWP